MQLWLNYPHHQKVKRQQARQLATVNVQYPLVSIVTFRRYFHCCGWGPNNAKAARSDHGELSCPAFKRRTPLKECRGQVYGACCAASLKLTKHDQNFYLLGIRKVQALMQNKPVLLQHRQKVFHQSIAGTKHSVFLAVSNCKGKHTCKCDNIFRPICDRLQAELLYHFVNERWHLPLKLS